MQLSYGQIGRRRAGTMDLKEVFGFVDPKVRNAALQVAEQLEKLGIRFALVGGLAVGVHGYCKKKTRPTGCDQAHPSKN